MKRSPGRSTVALLVAVVSLRTVTAPKVRLTGSVTPRLWIAWMSVEPPVLAEKPSRKELGKVWFTVVFSTCV